MRKLFEQFFALLVSILIIGAGLMLAVHVFLLGLSQVSWLIPT